MERTFIMIKPDGVQRGLIGDILKRFEAKGFKLVGLKLTSPGQSHIEEHYSEHRERPFFAPLVAFVSSGPVAAMVWEGHNAIATGRKMIGATNPDAAEMGTIRGDYSADSAISANIEKRAIFNLIHASETPEEAAHEIKHWFGKKGIYKYKRFGVDE